MPDEIVTMTPSEFKELKHSEMLMAVGFEALSDYTDALEHHGIKDQKWGVKNGPPYPLNKEGKAKFEENLRKRTKAGKVSVGSAKGDIKREKAELPKVSIGGLFNKNKNSKSETEKADEEEKKKPTSSSNSDDKKDPEMEELDRLDKEEAAKEEAEKPKEMSPEERKKDMQDAVKSGDYERVQKYFSELTPDQISEAITRMDLQRNLNRYAPKEPKPQQQEEPAKYENPYNSKEYIQRRNAEAVANADLEYAQNHFDKMSDSDLEKIINRIDKKTQLDSKSDKWRDKKAMDKIDSVVKNLDKVNGWAEKGIKWWNTAAKINNTFSENKWPMIDTNISTKYNIPASFASKLKAQMNEKNDDFIKNFKDYANSATKNQGKGQSTNTQQQPKQESQNKDNSSTTQTTSTATNTSNNNGGNKKKNKNKKK